MGNNARSNSLSVISIAIIIVVGIVLGYFVYTTLLSSSTESPSANTKVQLKTDQFKSLTEIKDYGQKVTSTEPGYGRSDPFAPVQ
jgi:flagellar basal body-associated protein FliL